MNMLNDQVRQLAGDLLAEFDMSPNLFKEIARIEHVIAETYRSRISYELLQNSDDAEATEVTVEISKRTAMMIWSNNGRPLNFNDIESMCRSAISTKSGTDAIGYRGIGFKALASAATCIEVLSNDISFSFERKATAEQLKVRYPNAINPELPLIRIPTNISVLGHPGVSFRINLHDTFPFENAPLNPLSLLFLRNVEKVNWVTDEEVYSFTITRNDDLRTLTLQDGQIAEFRIIAGRYAEVAVPINDVAVRSLPTLGLLFCFLPLKDHVGIPLAISGRIATDPSRTHAVLDEEATRNVLTEAAELVCESLRNQSSILWEVLWELLVSVEDPRVFLVSGLASPSGVFWNNMMHFARKYPIDVKVPASGIPQKYAFAGSQMLAPRCFNCEIPTEKYRALRATLDLKELSISDSLKWETVNTAPLADQVTLANLVAAEVRRENRDLDKRESELLQRVTTNGQPTMILHEPDKILTNDSGTNAVASMGEHMERWKSAERAVLQFLNDRGWDLKDVSLRNAGYDLGGTDNTATTIAVEVKKVKSRGETISLTTNEMSLLQAGELNYVLAIVVGEGYGSELWMVNDSSALSFERVCKQWSWCSADWALAADRLA